MAITLAKGQGLSLEKSQHNLSLVTIGLGWDIATQKESFLGGLFGEQPAEYDLDVVAFLCDTNGTVRDVGRDASGNPTLKNSDVIFFNNLRHRSGHIWLTGDNRTGAGDGDDETVFVELDKVDSIINELVFVVTIHEAEKRKQNFGQVRNAFIRLYDQDTNKEVAKFELDEDFSKETAVEFGKLYKKDGQWRFQAVGQGYNSGLQGFVDRYFAG